MSAASVSNYNVASYFLGDYSLLREGINNSKEIDFFCGFFCDFFFGSASSFFIYFDPFKKKNLIFQLTVLLKAKRTMI